MSPMYLCGQWSLAVTSTCHRSPKPPVLCRQSSPSVSVDALEQTRDVRADPIGLARSAGADAEPTHPMRAERRHVDSGVGMDADVGTFSGFRGRRAKRQDLEIRPERQTRSIRRADRTAAFALRDLVHASQCDLTRT